MSDVHNPAPESTDPASVVTAPVVGGFNPNDPESVPPGPAQTEAPESAETTPSEAPAEPEDEPALAAVPGPIPPDPLPVTAEPVKKPAPEKTNRDIIERAVWTAIQAGLGVITVEGLHLPVEYAVLVATALSAVKSYVKKQLDVPWV